VAFSSSHKCYCTYRNHLQSSVHGSSSAPVPQTHKRHTHQVYDALLEQVGGQVGRRLVGCVTLQGRDDLRKALPALETSRGWVLVLTRGLAASHMLFLGPLARHSSAPHPSPPPVVANALPAYDRHYLQACFAARSTGAASSKQTLSSAWWLHARSKHCQTLAKRVQPVLVACSTRSVWLQLLAKYEQSILP